MGETRRSGAPRIELVRDMDRPNGYLLSVDGVAQSYVDLDDPTYLELEYVALLADAVDACFPTGGKLAAAHLGAGACTLARWVAATRPGSRQRAYDNDEELVEVVNERLGGHDVDGLSVEVADARAALEQMRDRSLDVVVTDVFDGPRACAELFTLEAIEDVGRVIRSRGIWLANIADRAPFTFARPVLAGLSQVLPYAAALADIGALRGRRYGHLVLLGAHRPLPEEELLRRAARAVPAVRLVTGDALTEFVGGTAPSTDADPARSPLLRSWIYPRS